jgi:hypothetical protein
VPGDVDDRGRPDRSAFLIKPFDQPAMFVIVHEEIVRTSTDAVEHVDNPSTTRPSRFDLGAELREGFVVPVEVS